MPRRKVQVSGTGMDRDRAWVCYFAQQGLPVRAVKFGDIQVFRVTIQPIQFPANPIDSDTFEAETVVTDDWFLLAAIYWCPKQEEFKFKLFKSNKLFNKERSYIIALIRKRHVQCTYISFSR